MTYTSILYLFLCIIVIILIFQYEEIAGSIGNMEINEDLFNEDEIPWAE